MNASFLKTCAVLTAGGVAGVIRWVYFLMLNQNQKYCSRVLKYLSKMCGYLSWVVIIPIDTIKTRIQAAAINDKAPSIDHVARQLIQKDGLSALMRGVGLSNVSTLSNIIIHFNMLIRDSLIFIRPCCLPSVSMQCCYIWSL